MDATAMQLPAMPPALPRSTRRLRVLHFFYARGTTVNFWIARRLGPAGMSICLLLIATSFIAMSQPRDSSYQLFSMTVAMAFFGLAWAAARGAKAETVRHLPHHGTAGVPLRYMVEVTNTGRRRLMGVTLAETAIDPRPSAATFMRVPEPGESERNAFDRFFAYYRWQWLTQRARLFEGGRAISFFNVNPGETIRAMMEITPRRRGVIALRDMRMILPDPLGLFQSCPRIDSSSNTLVVLPRRYPIPPIELPGGASYRIGSEANTNSIGTNGEFVGLRDYRSGDAMRLIHWKSWARTGKPIVKELEDTHYPRHGLVIDTFAGGTQDAAFEELISVAASFAAGLDTRESLLDLMFVEDKAHRVTVGRGVERAEKLLEVLAAVALKEADGFHDLANLVKRHSQDLGSCLVVLLGWDSRRAAFLADLRRNGILCVPVVVGFGQKPKSCPGHWIDAAKPARDLSRMPLHPEH
ncbi:MAG: DUF58 domain-containing protein [Luteolibacter sp.]|jgi:uncharacterized protein (DUF58 family)